MNSTLKKKLDEALIDTFAGDNLPFSLVESPMFKKFLFLLNPAYKPPCRKTLATTLLDGCVKRQALKHNTKPRNGTLMLDGWKNSSNNTKQVAVMVKPNGEDEIFLKTYNFSTSRATHGALLEVIDDASLIALEKYHVNITAYVSDHASAEKKAGEESGLIHYGCHAHAGNLFLKDVKNGSTYDKVHAINLKFRNPQLESRLKGRGGRSVYFANATRWKGT